MLRTVVFGLITFSVAGCAGGAMNRIECAGANWRGYGYEDGSRGQPLSMANERAKSCARHGKAIDHAAYDRGREEGLEQFCSAERAEQMGFEGKRYRGQCLHQNETSFRAAYETGVQRALVAYCTPSGGYREGTRGVTYDGRCKQHDEATFLAAFHQGRELFGYTSSVEAAEDGVRKVEERLTTARAIIAQFETRAFKQREYQNFYRRFMEASTVEAHILNEELPQAKTALMAAQRELFAYRKRMELTHTASEPVRLSARESALPTDLLSAIAGK